MATKTQGINQWDSGFLLVVLIFSSSFVSYFLPQFHFSIESRQHHGLTTCKGRAKGKERFGNFKNYKKI